MLCIKLNECLFGAVPCQWTLRKSDTEWTPAPEWNFAPCFSFHEYAYQRGYFNAGIDFFTVAAKSAQLPAEMWCEHPFPLSDAPFRHHCALGNDPYAEYLYSMYGHSASISRCMAAWTGVIISSCADCAGSGRLRRLDVANVICIELNCHCRSDIPICLVHHALSSSHNPKHRSLRSPNHHRLCASTD